MPDSLPWDGSLFAELLDAAPDATVILDEAATIRLANRAVERVFGHERSQLVGRPVEVLIPERLRGPHRQDRGAFLRAAGLDPTSAGIELHALHRDGHEVPVEVSLSPVQTDAGLLVSASVRDITERKRLQEEASRMRDELIATVSHELRTPLTSIIGYAELLGDLGEDQVGPHARRLLAVIERNAVRELRLVDDLLTMAFLDGDRLRIVRSPMQLETVVQRVAADQLPRALETGVHLVAQSEPLAPVEGDFHRLVQVAENLVANALKFTSAGGTVTVRTLDAGGCAVLEVADTGVGVRREELPRLFERLYRTPSAVASHTQGAGLGLTIVQKIVQAHEGCIHVDSELGQGTTFRVELPYAAAVAAGR